MDATAYVELSDAIAAAATAEQIQGIEARLEAMELHPLDRLALKRVARVRRELIGRNTPPYGALGLDTSERRNVDDQPITSGIPLKRDPEPPPHSVA